MPQPTVSVVVPTFQRASALERTLAALCALDYPDELVEICVVDDGSTDSTRQSVARFPGVGYVFQPNRGVAAARNRGARLASGEILVFVDDDTVVGPDNLRRHLGARDQYGECIVSGHSEFDPELRAALERSPFGRFRLWVEDFSKLDQAERWGSQGRIEPSAVAAQNLSIRRSLFCELGGFDERFPVGAEDQDLCLRASAAGCTIVHDYNIRVIHNDQHGDLRALCRREERGAVGIVYLSRKHPGLAAPATLDLNGPLRRTDSPRLMLRKIVRGAMSQPAPLAGVHRLIEAVEIMRPEGGWPLEYLYRALTGLYVFRGIRRGLRLTSRKTWLPGHEAS